jgi:hypothetical protein
MKLVEDSVILRSSSNSRPPYFELPILTFSEYFLRSLSCSDRTRRLRPRTASVNRFSYVRLDLPTVSATKRGAATRIQRAYEILG